MASLSLILAASVSFQSFGLNWLRATICVCVCNKWIIIECDGFLFSTIVRNCIWEKFKEPFDYCNIYIYIYKEHLFNSPTSLTARSLSHFASLGIIFRQFYSNNIVFFQLFYAAIILSPLFAKQLTFIDINYIGRVRTQHYSMLSNSHSTLSWSALNFIQLNSSKFNSTRFLYRVDLCDPCIHNHCKIDHILSFLFLSFQMQKQQTYLQVDKN